MKCALKLVNEINLYYDARAKKTSNYGSFIVTVHVLHYNVYNKWVIKMAVVSYFSYTRQPQYISPLIIVVRIKTLRLVWLLLILRWFLHNYVLYKEIHWYTHDYERCRKDHTRIVSCLSEFTALHLQNSHRMHWKAENLTVSCTRGCW